MFILSLKGSFEYAYSSAVVSASLSKLIISTTYKKILEANSLQDSLELLHQTPYNKIPTEIQIREDFGIMLDKKINNEIEQKIKHILSASPKKDKLFLNNIIEQKENDVLKSVLRAMVMKVDKNYALTKIAPFGRITYNICQELINSNSIEKTIRHIKHISLQKELSSVLTGKISDKTVFEIDIIFEKHYIKKIKKELKKLRGTDKEKMMIILGADADIRNLINYFRAINLGLSSSNIKQYRIPIHRHLTETNLNEIAEAEDFSKAQSSIPDIYRFITNGIKEHQDDFLSFFELSYERYLASIYLNFFRGYRMNMGLIWAYLKLLLYEVSDIRTILMGKMYNIQNSEIKNKLILYDLI